jgi:hypothetical protein
MSSNTLKVHPASHVDHVGSDIIDSVLAKFADRSGFFIESFELPEGQTVECGLYGPACGDAPVTDAAVRMEARPGRENLSRLIDLPMRPTRTLTVIAGPTKDEDGTEHACVLYTVYGGPVAPREPTDPTLPDHEREASEAFWAEHALAG